MLKAANWISSPDSDLVKEHLKNSKEHYPKKY
jgi:hypothetical protein